MTAIVRIDDELVDDAEFIRLLKLTGQFESLIEQLVRDKLTVHAAKKQGVTVSADEIQQRAIRTSISMRSACRSTSSRRSSRMVCIRKKCSTTSPTNARSKSTFR
jgi:hypothetical protein